MSQKHLKVYLGKSNAAKLQTVIAAKTFLKDKLGCEIVEWSSTASQETNDRRLLSCDLMYIIPDPLAGLLGKGLYESIKKFKTFAAGLVVMERDGCIESVTKVETSSYSRDWSRYGTYQVGKKWAHRNTFFNDEFNIQTVTDGMRDYTTTVLRNPEMVTIDIETSNIGTQIYINDSPVEVMFKQSQGRLDRSKDGEPMKYHSYTIMKLSGSWEDDPCAMLLIELF